MRLFFCKAWNLEITFQIRFPENGQKGGRSVIRYECQYNGGERGCEHAGCLYIAAYGDTVARVHWFCMTPGMGVRSFEGLWLHRTSQTHIRRCHEQGFNPRFTCFGGRRQDVRLARRGCQQVVHNSFCRTCLLVVHFVSLQSCLNCRHSRTFPTTYLRHVLVLSFVLQVFLILAVVRWLH